MDVSIALLTILAAIVPMAAAVAADATTTSYPTICDPTNVGSVYPPTATSEIINAVTSWIRASHTPGSPEYCEISTAIAPSLTSEYSAYGTSCASWYESKASAFMDVESACNNLLPVNYASDFYLALYAATCFGADSGPGATATSSGIKTTPPATTTEASSSRGTSSTTAAGTGGTPPPNGGAMVRADRSSFGLVALLMGLSIALAMH